MAASAAGPAPASIRKVAFEHLQHIARRMLHNLFENQSDSTTCASIAGKRCTATLHDIITESLQRECNSDLVRFWKERENELKERAVSPDQVPQLHHGLESPPSLQDLLDLKLIGLHLLVRQGFSSRYAYFCPEEEDETYWLAPYCYPSARDGIELRSSDGSANKIGGLTTVEVSGDPGKLGSHLAVKRGMCQYIPDLFDREVRQKIGYAEIDILSRNRCSLYLAINEPPDCLNQEPASAPPALLIIQSAIPRLFGADGLIAFDDPLYQGLRFSVAPAFFQSIFDLMFAANHRQQMDELMAYAHLLSGVAHASDELHFNIRRDERAQISHLQVRTWGYVRGQYKALQSGGTSTSADEVRLGGILLDHLGLSAGLGLDRLNPETLGSSHTEMHDFAGLLPLLGNQPSDDNWFKSMDSDPVEALCAKCKTQTKHTIKVQDSVVAAIWLDLAHNATKHGIRPDDGLKPRWVWGCKHQLLSGYQDSLVVVPTQGRFDGWRMESAPKRLFEDSDIFVGAIDYTPIPKGATSLRSNRLGLRLLLRLCGLISKLDKSEVHVCYVPLPRGVNNGGVKAAVALFPHGLCY